MKKNCCIVYYSNSGNVKKLAELIAKELSILSTDIERISCKDDFKNSSMFGMFKQMLKGKYAINPLENIQFENYEKVILCTSMYTFKFAGPFKSFLEMYKEPINKSKVILVKLGVHTKIEVVKKKYEAIMGKIPEKTYSFVVKGYKDMKKIFEYIDMDEFNGYIKDIKESEL